MKLDSLSKVKVPVQVVLGDTQLSLEEISTLGEGSVIQLQAFAGEPVDFYAAGKKIAVGEVVIIDECFGIRLTAMKTE